MRKRMLSPELFTSATFCELTIPARLTFIGLWSYCDDEGRGEESSLLIKAALWPRDKKVTDRAIDGYLVEMVDNEHICIYKGARASKLHIPSWKHWQKISHPTPSRLQPCPDHEPDAFAAYSARIFEEGLGRRSGIPPEGFLANVVEVSADKGSSRDCGHAPRQPKTCATCRQRGVVA